VAEEAGTTRDYVEVSCEWDGVLVRLLDTAGRRESESATERRGIALGASAAVDADVVVEVDSSPQGLERVTPDARTLLVHSKCDLSSRGEGLRTSAHTGEGLEDLKKAVLEKALGGRDLDGDAVVISSERQRSGLVSAAEALSKGLQAAAEGLPLDVIAQDLRSAAESLGGILGENVYEGMLDDLFGRFCIGK